MLRGRVLLLALSLILTSLLRAKDDAGIVMLWPTQESASLKLTFGRFRTVEAYAGKLTLVSDVVIENLSSKAMPQASFSVFLLDKDHVRIGNGLLVVNDLNPSESAKVLFQCDSVGAPVTLSIVTIGNHNLEFQKDGYGLSATPVDVAADDLPNGSIKITLAGLANDVVNLRDGSSLSGDVMSMDLDSIVIRVDGKDQKIDRNQVNKIYLVERIVTHVPVTDPQGKAKASGSAAPTPHR